MMLNEQISFGGRSVAGFQLVGIGAQAERLLTYNAGETWELNLYADQPVSSEKFIALATEIQSSPTFEVISFTPLTDRHFRAIVKWTESGPILSSDEEVIEGVRYTVTAKPYSEATLPPGGGLIAPTPDPTFPVQVDFSSDQPVTPQQFFALVDAVQQELVPAESTVSFMPLTESTFRGVFNISQPGGTMLVDAIPVGESAEIQGVTFTITGVKVLDEEGPTPAVPTPVPAPPVPTPAPVQTRPVPAAPAPAPVEEEEKKGLSTAAMVGIGVAVVAVGGGAVYAATRKKKKRQRQAA